jgi:DNA primase
VGIVDEDIVRVREASDIVAVVTQHTQLRKVGQRWSGLCPFHTEKSPSFSVNATEGLYYCFGCRASGDVITFVREIEHLDFAAAVEWLASKSGIAVRYTDHDEGETRKRTKRLQALMTRAVDWYHDRLLSGSDAGAARSYLRSRGFDRDMVARYQVGWAPDSWDQLAKALRVHSDVLVDCGLGFVNKAGRQQDFFRRRILFPIFDDQGHPVAFGGRKLPDDEGPKYQNSRENALYNKSRTLYGLNWAKTNVVQSGEVVICEGYTDVIGFFQADIPRAVATCGTSLTEDHIRSLKRFTNKLILAYDADEAGQAASERVYEWEQRHEIEVSVISLPPGADPDELSRSDPAALATAVADARPFLEFRVRRALAAGDLSTSSGRVRAAESAIDVLREHPSPLARDAQMMFIADTCRLEPDLLRAQLAQPARPRPVETKPTRRRQPDGDDDGRELSSRRPVEVMRESAELEALRLFVHRRPEIGDRLRPVLFTSGLARTAFEAVLAAGDIHRAIDEASPQVADLLARLAVEESSADVDDVVILLLTATTARAVAALGQRMRLSEDPLEYAPSMSWLKLRIDELTGDEPNVESADQLLAWLEEHAIEFA